MEFYPVQPVLVVYFIRFIEKIIITKARNIESTNFYPIEKTGVEISIRLKTVASGHAATEEQG